MRNTLIRGLIFCLSVASGGAVSAQTGLFRIQGTKIIDPNGKVFIPIGGNVNGAPWVWEYTPSTVGLADAIEKAWRFNCIRVNIDADGKDPKWPVYSKVNNVDEIVNTYTARKIVVMLEVHDWTCGSGARLDPDHSSGDLENILVPWWKEQAEKYKDNPYVWFNIANEPGGSSRNNGMDTHFKAHDRVISVIRNEVKAKNIIVVDALLCGQDGCDYVKSNLTVECSSILTNGPKLNQKYSDILYSIHTYNTWERPEKLTQFINDAYARDLALIIGEAGYYGNQPDADWAAGCKNAITLGLPRGVGVLAWHLQPGDGFNLVNQGPVSAVNSWTDPTNLTWSGKLFWDATHTTKYGGRTYGLQTVTTASRGKRHGVASPNSGSESGMRVYSVLGTYLGLSTQSTRGIFISRDHDGRVNLSIASSTRYSDR